jgi:hypothetical protein
MDLPAHGPGAKPVDPSGGMPRTHAEIERRLLELAASLGGARPVRQSGTNSSYWRFTFKGRATDFSVVSPEGNTATPPTGGVLWILRIQEPDPPLFAAEVGRLFRPGSGLVRAMAGGVRTQFKSTEWA